MKKNTANRTTQNLATVGSFPLDAAKKQHVQSMPKKRSIAEDEYSIPNDEIQEEQSEFDEDAMTRQVKAQ